MKKAFDSDLSAGILVSGSFLRLVYGGCLRFARRVFWPGSDREGTQENDGENGDDGNGRDGDEAEVATATARPMRADAKRNYELLVTAARKVFDQEGGGASMEAIAKEAGVGIGTLYRHFPKRIDVVEAVYVDDVDELETVARHGERRPRAVARVRGLARGLRPLRDRQEALHERAARGVREGPGPALGVA